MSIFRVHIPFLDEVKAHGVRKALLLKADDVVTRITAGLSIADVRAVLRDDPPGRPNPRLKPHSEGFWLHMRPTYYHNLVDGLYPTFRLGWLSTYFFAVEIITGIILMVYYTPSPLVAYENMLNILSNVPFGRLMRDIHRLGAELMVIAVALHMLRTFITGSYKKPRQFTWATGVILLGVTLFLSFSGYLLPWDQLSLWAVTIGASMIEAAPPEVVGKTLSLMVLGGPQIGANGLLRFYLLHVVALPFVGLIAFGVHYYKVIHHGHSLPPEAEEIGVDSATRVPMNQRSYFMPKILTRELFYVSVFTLLLVVVAAYFFHAPLEPHADPQVTPLHTTAPWYFLWLQGMLKLGDKVIWGVIVPTIMGGLLLLLPYLEVGPSRRYAHRRVGLTIAALSVVALAVLSFMGTPWYGVTVTPEVEAVAVILPQTHPGPLRTSPWEEIEYGSFEASAWASAPTPALRELLRTFDHELDRMRAAGQREVEGFMIVEDWQPGLKKITMRVVWVDGETGEPGEFSQVAYFHRDSNYAQGE
jgi:quinol-cytochrome oxidoreductase complex cytochrome b subunit